MSDVERPDRSGVPHRLPTVDELLTDGPQTSVSVDPKAAAVLAEQDVKHREKIGALASAHRHAGTVTKVPRTVCDGSGG